VTKTRPSAPINDRDAQNPNENTTPQIDAQKHSKMLFRHQTHKVRCACTAIWIATGHKIRGMFVSLSTAFHYFVEVKKSKKKNGYDWELILDFVSAIFLRVSRADE
jgi:hypothetical protein